MQVLSLSFSKNATQPFETKATEKRTFRRYKYGLKNRLQILGHKTSMICGAKNQWLTELLWVSFTYFPFLPPLHF